MYLIYVYKYKYENGCIHKIRSLLNPEDPTISCHENAIHMYWPWQCSFWTYIYIYRLNKGWYWWMLIIAPKWVQTLNTKTRLINKLSQVTCPVWDSNRRTLLPTPGLLFAASTLHAAGCAQDFAGTEGFCCEMTSKHGHTSMIGIHPIEMRMHPVKGVNLRHGRTNNPWLMVWTIPKVALNIQNTGQPILNPEQHWKMEHLQNHSYPMSPARTLRVSGWYSESGCNVRCTFILNSGLWKKIDLGLSGHEAPRKSHGSSVFPFELPEDIPLE